MKYSLKKSASVLLLSTLAFTSISSVKPKPAHALIGAVSGSPATLITGSVIGGLGLLLVGGTAVALGGDQGSPDGRMAAAMIGIPVILAGMGLTIMGLIILDGSEVEFGHLNGAQAKKLGLTVDELAAYEDELEEINAILQEQKQARAHELASTGTIDVKNSAADWKRNGVALSPEAFSAIKKIAANAMSQATSARSTH